MADCEPLKGKLSLCSLISQNGQILRIVSFSYEKYMRTLFKVITLYGWFEIHVCAIFLISVRRRLNKQIDFHFH